MPRLLAVGHVTWDAVQGRDVAGGSVCYAALAARRLGWDAGVLSVAGPDFDPARELPGVAAFVAPGEVTTRFENDYARDGTRRQRLTACAGPLDFSMLPDAWRDPDVLLLAPVAGELSAYSAELFQAQVVGALAQGWLREVDAGGDVHPCEWHDPAGCLAGVHAVVLSEHDLPNAGQRARALLDQVPIVVLTRGWQGLLLHTRDARHEVPALPREEVDPTGAGDVLAAAFLVRYHECGDLLEAAAFGVCAASCAVEGVGTSTLGDRAEVERRLLQRERLIEDGEWEG